MSFAVAAFGMDPIEAWARANYGLAAWLAAVGTVGALIFLAIETTRAGRAERRRCNAVLRALITMLDATVYVLLMAKSETAAGRPPAMVAQKFVDSDAASRTLATLEGVGLADVPNDDAVNGLVHSRALLRQLDKKMREAVGGTPLSEAQLDWFIDEIRTAIATLDRAWDEYLPLRHRVQVWRAKAPRS